MSDLVGKESEYFDVSEGIYLVVHFQISLIFFCISAGILVPTL